VNLRRTKIITTLGPATDDQNTLKNMLTAGVDLVRLNMSHGDQNQQLQRAELVRNIAKSLNKEIGVLVDLQGPKIRIAKFKSGVVVLTAGQRFTLNPNLAPDAGNNNEVSIDYQELANDLSSDDILLLDDGRIVLKVINLDAAIIHTEVIVGGDLSNNKGINRQGGGITASAFTAKDRSDIEFAKAIQADYLAISFVKTAQDIKQARSLIGPDSTMGIIAKIECTQALKNLNEIIAVTDAIMVARGDLGVEIGVAEVPGVQKKIINLARIANKAVITATQMMESMVTNTVPTRAEVSDVANAVLDGSDAVMLSAETAVGNNPTLVVQSMAQACLAAERHIMTQEYQHRSNCYFKQVDEAIAMATIYTANHFDIKAIISLTETGTTALLISRIDTEIPIYGISRYQTSRGKMTLYRGVYPIAFDVTKFKRWEVVSEILAILREQNILKSGDRVIITRGDTVGISGRSNAMKIVTVE